MVGPLFSASFRAFSLSLLLRRSISLIIQFCTFCLSCRGSSFGRLLEIVCPLLSVELLRYPLLSSLVSIVLLAPLWTAIRKESVRKSSLFQGLISTPVSQLDQEDPKRHTIRKGRKKVPIFASPHLNLPCLAWANYISQFGVSSPLMKARSHDVEQDDSSPH
ncbi:hypothetical protein GBA52_015291 [Prunus armeniaca]|nr:hypothetical protein GBA52_015291 [Prunus armeniaca]